MLGVHAKTWWASAIRGVAAILFGLLAFIWPGRTVLVLITLFGAYCFVDGIFTLVAALRAAERHAHWAALLLEGVLSVLVGIIAFLHPGSVALAFIFLIAAWAIITGVLELFAAVRLHRELANEFVLGLSGLVSLAFGVLLLIFRPDQSLVAIAWIMGMYALLFGILLLGLSLRLRSWHLGGSGDAASAADRPV